MAGLAQGAELSELDVIQQIAGRMADSYISSFLLPAFCGALNTNSESEDDLLDAMADGRPSFEAILRLYAFVRRTTDRENYGAVVQPALDRAIGTDTFEEFLGRESPSSLGNEFIGILDGKQLKSFTNRVRPVVEGLVELAAEIYRQWGQVSIFEWIAEEIEETARIEHVYERLRSVRNMGPKTSSHILRDTVAIYSLEERIHPVDRPYLQPVGASLRALSPLLVSGSNSDRLPDFVLAAKTSKACRTAKVSGARFNMGASYLYVRLRNEPDFVAAVRNLIVSE